MDSKAPIPFRCSFGGVGLSCSWSCHYLVEFWKLVAFTYIAGMAAAESAPLLDSADNWVLMSW